MRIYQNFNLLNYNAYRITAFCARAYFPENENDVIKLLLEHDQVPKIVLGNGNNVILSKKIYNEHFIIFSGCFDKVNVLGVKITAETGATMLQLSETAMVNSLSGFEIFYDIPSSVGGAVVMNAGAGDKEIKDLLVRVRYLDLSDSQIKEIARDEIDFEYRNSFFQKNTDKVVLKAWFKLKKGKRKDIYEEMQKIKKNRWTKQPREYPNCGSVFKRPKERYVGSMIEELGLKGFSIGDARVSEKHAGFIINTGNATGKDILQLIYTIKDKVKSAFNVNLELEQRII